MKIGVEGVNFQAQYVQQIKEKLQQHRYMVDVQSINQTHDKILRIKSFAPLLNNGQIKISNELFKDDSHLLWSQMRLFPQSKKDGPDVCQGANEMLNSCSLTYDHDSIPLFEKENKNIKYFNNRTNKQWLD
jgi:phage terminase large subunit-like protein